MRKLAFFVEGQTEAVFIERLVEEIAGEDRVIVERRKASGGRKRIAGTAKIENSHIFDL